MSFDLFISHSSADAETARALVTDFENRGITCWMAPRDIPMGSSYQGEIVKAIEHCRAMLLLFSNAANDSEHVLREVELAAQNRKPIYPLRIDATEPAGGLRYMLANKQWVERKALGNRLVDTVEQLLSGNGAARPPDSQQTSATKPRVSPAVIGAGVVAACLLLGAGVFAMQGSWPWAPKRVVEAPAPPVVSAVPEPPKPVVAAPEPPKPVVAAPEPPKSAIAVAPTPPAQVAPPPQVMPPPAVVPPAAEPPKPVQEAAPPAPPPPAPAPPVQEARAPSDVAPPVVKPGARPDVATTAPESADVVPGKVLLFQECELCPVMAAIPAGRNLVGSPDDERNRAPAEGPRQEIAIAKPFAAGWSEVTFDQFFACIAEGGCRPDRPGDYGWGTGLRPVINVSWTDARAYVAWLSQKTGATYRLLSEAEWEYAARGCVVPCRSTPFWFGMDISKERANYDWRFSYEGSPKALPPRRTVEIWDSQPNPFGLMQLHGNVREWVEDCWNPSLNGLPKDGAPRRSGDCQGHVVRGGSWADEPKDVRSATRNWEVTTERNAKTGFRVGRTLTP